MTIGEMEEKERNGVAGAVEILVRDRLSENVKSQNWILLV